MTKSMTRCLNVTLKTTGQHLTVRSGISEAEVTNNRRSHRRIVLLKLTTNRHEASRGFFATTELLVYFSTVILNTRSFKITKLVLFDDLLKYSHSS